jgi:hypothetical protein
MPSHGQCPCTSSTSSLALSVLAQKPPGGLSALLHHSRSFVPSTRKPTPLLGWQPRFVPVCSPPSMRSSTWTNSSPTPSRPMTHGSIRCAPRGLTAPRLASTSVGQRPCRTPAWLLPCHCNQAAAPALLPLRNPLLPHTQHHPMLTYSHTRLPGCPGR